MERGELKHEQAEMEEEEVEKITPLVRKSRNGDESKMVAVLAVNGEVSNGVSDRNGHAIQIAQNGLENDNMIPPEAEEQKIEEGDGVLAMNGELKIQVESRKILENETEFVNGEQEKEETDGVLENELEFITGKQKIEESNGVSENELEFITGEQKVEESNGVLENELEFPGEQKIEESNGVLENESESINGEQKIEERDSVLEIESEVINGDLKPDNLVFHERDEGLWKCRICTWTCGNGSFSVELIQNHREQLHNLMTINTLSFDSEGVKSSSTYIVEEQIQKGPGPKKFGVSDAHVEEIEENGISGSNLQLSDSSSEEGGRSHHEPSKEIESAEIDPINEDDLEITEVDVERVIQKQTTHDLYCPNCKSCITKRVILRKRKRRIKILDEDVKRNKTGTTVSTQSPEDQAHQEDGVGISDAQETMIDGDGHDREPDIFRCLSCFSFFIPTGNGFKLFKKNWFTNIFTPTKLETAVKQGSSSRTNMKQVYSAIPSSDSAPQSDQPSFLEDTSQGLNETSSVNITQEDRNTSPSFTNLKTSVNGNVIIGAIGELDMKATEAVVSEGLEGTTGLNATHEGGNKTLTFPNLRPFVKWKKPANGVGGKLDLKATEASDATHTIQQFDVLTTDQPKESKPIQEVHINQDINLSVTTLPIKTQVASVEFAEDSISFPQKDGLKFLITSNKGSPILKNVEEGKKPNQAVQTGEKVATPVSPPSASVIQASDVDGKLNISLTIPHEEQDVTATIVTKSVLENKNVDSRIRDGGKIYPPEVPQQIISETKIEVHPNEPIETEFSSALLEAPVAKGNDTVITIDRQLAAQSHIAEDIILPTATTAAAASQSETQVSTVDSEERKIEVIKSVVYGGLAESITSLSVISSSAGGGATTLNVLALAAANLIGGLFVISHNLWDLRCDQAEQVPNQITEQKDRYRELLGRRQNFMLHVVVAIISYLTFGLVCPVVYGFSFRESEDKQLKLVAAAAASLVCILILAAAKAYVQRPPKPYLKTVFSFMIMGFMVSGVSYAAGELAERLLEKLGLFEASSAAPNLLVQEKGPVRSGWASY